MKRLSWKDWSRKHYQLYIVIVYVIGIAMGFGIGFQYGLWKQALQSTTLYVYSLLGAV